MEADGVFFKEGVRGGTGPVFSAGNKQLKLQAGVKKGDWLRAQTGPNCGRTVAARCLSPFFTVLGIHRLKKGTGTVGKPKTAEKSERDRASPHFPTPSLQLD
jgi:hypothetical protein